MYCTNTNSICTKCAKNYTELQLEKSGPKMDYKVIFTVAVCFVCCIKEVISSKESFICLKKCRCSETQDTFVVDCSNTGLNSVPKELPSRTTHLLLNNNNIQILHNDSFVQSKWRLPNLITVSIRSNPLIKAEINAFRGLVSLKILDLYNNNLQFKGSYPKSVFVPISQSLQVLDIRRNLLGDISQMDYPVSVGELIGLKELRIDCLKDKSLPMEYGRLKNLKKLSFADGRKEVGFIRNDMFKAVSKSGITDVNLGELNIGVIGNNTFSSLPKLRTLDLSNNPYVIIHIENIIQSLKKTAIQTLHLNHTGIGQAESTKAESTTQVLRIVGELHLKELTLDNNAIEKLDPVFAEYLPDLEVLSLGENFIDFDFDFDLFSDFRKLKNLTGLNVSGQNQNVVKYNESQMTGKKLQRIKNTKSFGLNTCYQDMACPLLFPSKIQWMDISQMGMDAQLFPEYVFLSNSTLRSIDMSFNRISVIKHPIYCPTGLFRIVPQIETIIFNNNGLQCVNSTLFSHCDWSSLTHLYLRNNQLGVTEGNICNKDKNNTLEFLKPAVNLEYLDLARNQIQNGNSLSEIQHLAKLKVIDLSDNGLHNFPLELENMTGLSRLILSNNNIRCLSMSTTLQLDKVQKLRTNYNATEIDLSGNLLSCTCGCFDFFQWMMVTELVLTNWKTYECQFNDGTKKSLDRLPFIVATVESQCFGTQWLKIYISIGILNYVMITIICLLCRARHTIKSFLNVYLRLSALEEKKNTKNKSKYVFSAFVSCDHRDAKYFVYRKLLPNLETEESKLKFCIAQRNFLVGGTIIDNIIRAVSKSRKVIFVVSQYFLTSKWCQEELLIAHQVSRDA